MPINIHQRLKRYPLYISGACTLCRSFLPGNVTCELQPTAFVLMVSQLCILMLGDTWVVLSCSLGNSPGNKLEQSQGSPHLFLLTQASLSCLPDSQCLKTIIPYIFQKIFSYFWQESKCSLLFYFAQKQYLNQNNVKQKDEKNFCQ